MKEEREESVEFESLQDLLKKIYPDDKPLEADDIIPTDSTPFYEQKEEDNKKKLFPPRKLSKEQIEEIKKSWEEIGNPRSLTELYDILINLGYMEKIENSEDIGKPSNEENENPKSVSELFANLGYSNAHGDEDGEDR